MGLRPTPDSLRLAFQEGLTLARTSDTVLPMAPEEITRRLHERTLKTFTPVFGSALLAKATEPRIDPLALKVSAGPRGYAASSAARVFFEQVELAGIDARCSTPAFLNNQPYVTRDRISAATMATCRDQVGLRILIRGLRDADGLERAEALRWLASFLRVREELTVAPVAHAFPPGVLTTEAAIAAAETFLFSGSDGGRRGQAVLLACLALGGAEATTAKVNDPSFRIPGDVAVWRGDPLHGGAVVAVGEAKQKVIGTADVLAAAKAAAARGIGCLVYAALAPGQPDVRAEGLAAERHGVAVEIHTSVAGLVRTSLVRSGEALATSLAAFPVGVQGALLALEAPDASLLEWESVVRAHMS